MRVKDAIVVLNQNYRSDEELAFAWWDKSIVESLLGKTLTDEQWSIIAERIECRDWDDLNEFIVNEFKE